MGVWIVGGQASVSNEEKEWVEECIWMSGVGGVKAEQGEDGGKETDGEGEEVEGGEGSKIKIAWRYEQMKKFQTTVNASTAYVSLYFGSPHIDISFPPFKFLYIFLPSKTII